MIYLDNNSTTRPCKAAIDACGHAVEAYGNPSSVHQAGQHARHLVETARAQLAALLGATPRQLILTSGGTESINLAIHGMRSNGRPRRLMVTRAEHSAVLQAADAIERNGGIVDRVPVDRTGLIRTDAWADALAAGPDLAVLHHANNETGVIQDVKTLATAAHEAGVPVLVDAVQSVGKLPINVAKWPVDFLSLSAHKFHGLKGAGALWVRRRSMLQPLVQGGHQEAGMRGGTENVPGILAMGAAAQEGGDRIDTYQVDVGPLRDRFESGVREAVDGVHVIGAGAPRMPNTSCLAFAGIPAEALLILLSENGICASAGAACSSGSLEPSHVLLAMDVRDDLAHGALRFSFSRNNTMDEVEQVLQILPDLVARLRPRGAASTST